MKRWLRLGAAAFAAVLAIRLLDWLLTPVLPLLGTLLVVGGVMYIVLHGSRNP